MKKIIKALAITATAAAMCVGIGAAAGCANTEETYVGEYHYLGYYGQEYGMAVEVTVKNNVITKIKDITNTEASKDIQTYKTVTDGKAADEATHHEWHSVSAGWDTYFMQNATAPSWCWILYSADGGQAGMGDKYYAELDAKGQRTGNYIKWDGKSVLPMASTATTYGWSSDDESNWTKHVSWLCDQYVGKSVADILALNVYVDYGYAFSSESTNSYGTVLDKDSKGEPYQVAYNADLSDSGLLISGSTQGSGRFLLAVQDALSK